VLSFPNIHSTSHVLNVGQRCSYKGIHIHTLRVSFDRFIEGYDM